eukprot:362989-Chlamydomonas_euryale.AAC.8
MPGMLPTFGAITHDLAKSGWHQSGVEGTMLQGMVTTPLEADAPAANSASTAKPSMQFQRFYI